MFSLFLPFFFIILNFSLFLFNKKIAHSLDLYDYPDSKRKLHKKKIALTGGLIFYVNLISLIFLNNIFQFEFFSYLNSRDFYSFFFSSTLIFLIGFYDDKYGVTANNKLILTTLVLLIFLSVGEIFILRDIRFFYNFYILYLNNFSLLFTIFCFLVFLNAFNMMDGINGLSFSYFILCLLYLIFFNSNLKIFYLFIIPGLFFLYFNFKNKMFLGDSGSLLLAFLLSCFFTISHNQDKILTEQIILVMILPGLDMLRVTFLRIINQQHAFEADNRHLHHILLKKYGISKAYIIIISTILIFLLLSACFFKTNYNLILILLMTFIYFVLVFKK